MGFTADTKSNSQQVSLTGQQAAKKRHRTNFPPETDDHFLGYSQHGGAWRLDSMIDSVEEICYSKLSGLENVSVFNFLPTPNQEKFERHFSLI